MPTAEELRKQRRRDSERARRASRTNEQKRAEAEKGRLRRQAQKMKKNAENRARREAEARERAIKEKAEKARRTMLWNKIDPDIKQYIFDKKFLQKRGETAAEIMLALHKNTNASKAEKVAMWKRILRFSPASELAKDGFVLTLLHRPETRSYAMSYIDQFIKLRPIARDMQTFLRKNFDDLRKEIRKTKDHRDLQGRVDYLSMITVPHVYDAVVKLLMAQPCGFAKPFDKPLYTLRFLVFQGMRKNRATGYKELCTLLERMASCWNKSIIIGNFAYIANNVILATRYLDENTYDAYGDQSLIGVDYEKAFDSEFQNKQWTHTERSIVYSWITAITMTLHKALGLPGTTSANKLRVMRDHAPLRQYFVDVFYLIVATNDAEMVSWFLKLSGIDVSVPAMIDLYIPLRQRVRWLRYALQMGAFEAASVITHHATYRPHLKNRNAHESNSNSNANNDVRAISMMPRNRRRNMLRRIVDKM